MGLRKQSQPLEWFVYWGRRVQAWEDLGGGGGKWEWVCNGV